MPLTWDCIVCGTSEELPEDETIIIADNNTPSFYCCQCARNFRVPKIDDEIVWNSTNIQFDEVEKPAKMIQKQIYNLTGVHVSTNTITNILVEGYQTDKGKLITRISKIPSLKKILVLKKNNGILSELGKAVAEWKTVKTLFKYGVLPWNYVGSGIIEGSRTCFDTNGENSGHRDFMEEHPTFQAIIWKNLNKSSFGRFITYRPAENTVYAGSHYSSEGGLTTIQIERLISSFFGEEFSFQSGYKPGIPIYRNNDWEVFTQGNKPSKDEHLYSCYQCGGEMLIDDFEDVDGQIICQECENPTKFCFHCSENVVSEEDELCRYCYTNTFICNLCSDRFDNVGTAPLVWINLLEKLTNYLGDESNSTLEYGVCKDCFCEVVASTVNSLKIRYPEEEFPFSEKFNSSVTDMQTYLEHIYDFIEELTSKEEEAQNA